MPLSEPALAILSIENTWEVTAAGRRYVFGDFVHWQRGKELLDKRILGRGHDLPLWTLHDIRWTFVTNMNELGFGAPHVVEAIVNHISGHKSGVAGKYNHAQYLEQRCEALEKWGRDLTGLVDAPNLERSRLLSTHQSNTPEKSDYFGSQLFGGTRS